MSGMDSKSVTSPLSSSVSSTSTVVLKKVTGWHLTGVTHYDELLAAVDRANGVLGKDLGYLVKNDYVKADIRRTEKRTDTQRETFAGVRL